LFAEIGQTSGSAEHLRAIHNLSDRLAPYRRVDAALFDDADAELEQLVLAAGDGKRADLAKLLQRYHRRRAAAASQLLSTPLQSRSGMVSPNESSGDWVVGGQDGFEQLAGRS
jgi:hypothetical protein